MKKVLLSLLLAAIMLMCSCSEPGNMEAVKSQPEITIDSAAESRTEKATESATKEPAGDSVLFRKNTVVDRPVQNKITTEIDRRLVGRYVNSKNSEAYIEIREDGTVACYAPFHTGGTDGQNSDTLSLLLYYRNDSVDLTFVSNDDRIFLDYGISLNFYTNLPDAQTLWSGDSLIGNYNRMK